MHNLTISESAGLRAYNVRAVLKMLPSKADVTEPSVMNTNMKSSLIDLHGRWC